MKKAHYGPYSRFLIKKIHGKKIVGKASRDEIESLCKKVAQSIAQVDSKRSEEEIYKELVDKCKIIYTEQLPVFSGAKGFALGNSIYIDQSSIYQIINGNLENLKDSEDYQTIVHECIHKLQNSRLKYRAKSVRGFVEGATELMALRATRKERSHYYGQGVSTNFPETAYANQVSLMAQLEIIFGKELVEDYALRQNQDLLDRVVEMLGDEQFDLLRKDMNADARGKETECDFNYWQNFLLETHFDDEIENIQSQEEAETYLSRLKQMESVRVKIDDDDTFKEYYLSKLEDIVNMYPDLDTEKFAYKESEFYPALYFDEEIKKLDENLLLYLTPNFGTIEDFQKINLKDYKRYRLVKNDKIYEVITFNGEANKFYTIDEDNEFASFNRKMNGDSEIFYPYVIGSAFEKKIDNILNLSAELDISIKNEDGKILLSLNPPLADSSIENEEMEEVPLNVTKKDIYEQMLIDESMSIKLETWIERIKRFFTRQKMLPPYSQVHEEKPDEGFKERYELPPEEKAKIERARIENLIEQRNHEIEEKNDLENSYDIR